MTSRSDGYVLTAADEQKMFDRALNDAIELGLRPPGNSPLPEFIKDDLTAIATAHPRTDADAVTKVRKLFREYQSW